MKVVHKSRPLAPPQVQGRPRNSKLLAGSDATFQVRVPGNPDPRIVWFKNGQRLYGSSRHVATYNDNVATLTIRNCQSDDAGFYTMLAENSKGRVATSVHLVIEESTRYRQVVPPRPQPFVDWQTYDVLQQQQPHQVTTTTTTHVQATFRSQQQQDSSNLYQAQ